MEAKEKAKELVEHYAETIEPIEYGVILERNWKNAKECALITVNEILKHEANCHSVLDGATEYWREVKQEIINF